MDDFDTNRAWQRVQRVVLHPKGKPVSSLHAWISRRTLYTGLYTGGKYYPAWKPETLFFLLLEKLLYCIFSMLHVIVYM